MEKIGSFFKATVTVFIALFLFCFLSFEGKAQSSAIMTNQIIQMIQDGSISASHIGELAVQADNSAQKMAELNNLRKVIQTLSSLKQGISSASSIARTGEQIFRQTLYFNDCLTYLRSQKGGTIQMIIEGQKLLTSYSSQTRNILKECQNVINEITKVGSQANTADSGDILKILDTMDKQLRRFQEMSYYASSATSSGFDALMLASELAENADAGAKLISTKIF